MGIHFLSCFSSNKVSESIDKNSIWIRLSVENNHAVLRILGARDTHNETSALSGVQKFFQSQYAFFHRQHFSQLMSHFSSITGRINRLRYFLEARVRFISSLFLLTLIFNPSLSLAEPVFAELSSEMKDADVAVLCEHYAEFKRYNTVLCAYGTQFKDEAQKLRISKNLACAYPSIRKDSRICPEKDVAAMKLPDLPYLLSTPMWPAKMKPVLTTVNGKALNEVLKMHEALFSNEYEISKYCVSKDSELQRTDRILCGPYIENISLVDAAKMPVHDINIYVAFGSGSTTVDYDAQWQLENAISTAINEYKMIVEAVNVPFNINKVKPTRIKVVGRADGNGKAATNRVYSEQRAYSTAESVRTVLSRLGVSIPEGAMIIDWVGSDESYCSEEYGTAVCRTEDAYGNFVSNRSGWRVSYGDGDRCFRDENGRDGWHYPIKKVCDGSDRSSRLEVHFEFELTDLKDAEIKRLKARLEELKLLKQKQKPVITIQHR